MSLLAIYPDNDPLQGERYSNYDAICQQLAAIGVQFERWATIDGLAADADPAQCWLLMLNRWLCSAGSTAFSRLM